MDTTAAAELGMGVVGGSVDGVGYWDAPQQEQDYEAISPARGGNPSAGAWGGRPYGQAPDSAYGRAGPGHGRPLPPGPEPAYKRMRMMPNEQQQPTGYGAPPGSGSYGNEVPAAVQGPGYGAGPNTNAGYWSAPAGAGEMGVGGGGTDTRWDAGYGMAPQWHEGAPGMAPDMYSGGGDMGYSMGTQYAPGGGPVSDSGAGRGRGAGSIFYKTKLCSKYKLGNCPFNTRCNFAHGMEELRKPPPGWEEMLPTQDGWGRGQRPPAGPTQGVGRGQRGPPDVQKFKTRPCKFFREGHCPYAERCTFLHDGPGMQGGEPIDNSTGNSWSGPATGGPNVGGTNTKPLSFKTRLCTQFENTGQCSFGDKCHFAHGPAELQKYGGGPADIPNEGQHAGSKFAGGIPYSEHGDVTAMGGPAYYGSVHPQENNHMAMPGPPKGHDDYSQGYSEWPEEQDHERRNSSARHEYPGGETHSKRDEKIGQGQYPPQQQPAGQFYRGGNDMYGQRAVSGQNGLQGQTRNGAGGYAQDPHDELGYHRQEGGYEGNYDRSQGWSGEY